MILHIANTQFEWELVQKKNALLEEGFGKSAIFLQLQFLPFLYADAEEGVAVTQKPTDSFFHVLESLGISFPRLHLLSETAFPYRCVESWGASPSVQKWAEEHGLHYEIPSWECVQKVNSKLFSFEKGPKLQNASLLYTQEQTVRWLHEQNGPKVFKTCFGVSGRGHHFVQSLTPETLLFLQKEWKEGRPVIAEPWVDRKLDFSTQWKISEEKRIEYIGATLCKNNERGVYQSNSVGEETKLFGDYLPHLENHKKIAKDVLEEMADLGYFGNVGIDAMLYSDSEALKLQPIVEINARKTMGWAALAFQRRYFRNKILTLHYLSTKSEKNLLPESLIDQRPFSRSLEFRPESISVYF